jgi:hypothetical protein
VIDPWSSFRVGPDGPPHPTMVDRHRTLNMMDRKCVIAIVAKIG